jgi:hypothetical protein
MEIWKYISGTNNSYQVSDLGRVRSTNRIVVDVLSRKRTYKGRYLNSDTSNGYASVRILINGRKRNCLVHRLVATEFLLNLHNKNYVNHMDGDKLNNCVSNLEWCTASENKLHAYHSLRRGYPIRRRDGKYHPRSKVILQISKQTNAIIAKFFSIREAYRSTGIHHESIRAAATNIRGYKSAGGYIWKFLDEN